MCAITGSINLNIERDRINSILKKLNHRGPDDHNYYLNQDINTSVFFAHNRLEILDISHGKQPMISDDGRYILIYNGEIYNFVELRNNLEQLGHKFKSTNSDTEVLLHGYKEWGRKLPNFLNGMWAFSIYDKFKNTLFLSRDRFGEKPLFYFYNEKKFIFSSELSGITQFNEITFNLSTSNLKKFCAHGYFPFDLTPYKNIFKLPGGNNIFLDISTMKLNVEKYWDYLIEPDYKISEDEWKEKLYYLLEKSVKKRLVADVPVGVFLSGGLDSSIITYFAQKNINNKLNTFSINFKEKTFDESKYSNYISEKIKTNHYAELINNKSIENNLREFLSKIDEPISDSSLISYYLLCKFSQNKIKVALCGDASDELFAGYDTFKAIHFLKLTKILKISQKNPLVRYLTSKFSSKNTNMNIKFKLDRLKRYDDKKLETAHPKWLSPMNKDEISDIFGEKTSDEELYSHAIDLWKNNNYTNNIDKSLEFYSKLFLQDQILVKTDRVSMMHGLEVRSPFLDYDLVEIIRKIPSKLKLKNTTGKYILKKIFEEKFGRKFVFRSKVGFTTPLSKWFFDNNTYILKSNFLRDKQKIYNEKLNQHKKNNTDNRIYLWNLINLDNFLNKINL